MSKLNDLEIYSASMTLSGQVWMEVSSWPYFEKATLGKQLVRSADSISANLSEGYGRYFYKEKRQFCYFSRGSAYETLTWVMKARERNLINSERADQLLQDIEKLIKRTNTYIQFLNEKLKEK